MRSFLRAASFASVALGLVWMVSAPTACGGGSEDLAPADDVDAGAETSTEGGPDNDNPVCGNGFKEAVEQCDDGNTVSGDGCEADCTLTCKPGPDGDKKCNDGNPCNGTETCGTDNKCATGTPPADGTTCGDAKYCKGTLCVDLTCGDGVVNGTEECDDANTTNGDGCDSCKFSCKSTDTARNCSSGDVCAGTSTCDDTTHKCSAKTPLTDGTTCGTGGVCKAGVCTAGSCGDGVVSGSEQCDFGTGNGAGTGCQVDCTFSCSKTADTCSDGNLCNGVETCQTVTVSGKTGQKCQAATAAADGTACGSGLVCKTGVCVSPTAVCGNGVVEAGEDCDFGTGNGPGTGCESGTCKFSCSKTPTDSCNDGNPCNGTETCGNVTVGGKTGQKCSPGTALAACAACGTGAVCVAGTCKSSTCGDSCVDTAKSEQCDPPASGTCDSLCKTIVVAVCGNGVREAGEQCDDGNKTNLDGCDSSCKFEQEHRANSLDMQFGTDTFCTKNQLGSAIASAGQTTIRDGLNNGVKDGSTNVLFKFLGLDDLTGTSDPSVTIGSLGGKPVAAPTGVTYNGASDLDWWYTVDPLTIDSSRNPTASGLITGSITAKALTAGPGNMTLMLQFSTGVVSPLNLSNVRIKSTIGAASTPTVSTGTTPGHLASEKLDPTLQSFATMSNGQLCGGVSAYSLSKVPVPSALLPGGSANCVEGYTTANSLLDVLIGGCRIFGGFVAVVNARQPDTEDPTAAAVGTGPTYTLSRSSTTTKIVDRCKATGTTGKTYNAGTPEFDACLKDAAYTAYFKFTTDRVIVK